jgi:hypothetical protein
MENENISCADMSRGNYGDWSEGAATLLPRLPPSYLLAETGNSLVLAGERCYLSKYERDRCFSGGKGQESDKQFFLLF